MRRMSNGLESYCVNTLSLRSLSHEILREFREYEHVDDGVEFPSARWFAAIWHLRNASPPAFVAPFA
jgi:hypothetical protein